MSAILDRAKKYSAEIQKRTRAEELVWFGDQLGVSAEQLLHLVGYRQAAVARHLANGESVAELAAKKPDGTLWMTEIFREMVHRNGYDFDQLAKSFRESPLFEGVVAAVFNGTVNGKPVTRTIRPPTPEGLARKVRAGGTGVYRAVTEYMRLTNRPSSRRTRTQTIVTPK